MQRTSLLSVKLPRLFQMMVSRHRQKGAARPVDERLARTEAERRTKKSINGSRFKLG
jgi:hypothetical protein